MMDSQALRYFCSMLNDIVAERSKLPFDACVRLARLYFCGRGLDCASLYSPSILYSSVTATRERKKELVVAQIENTDAKNLSSIIALSVTSCSISVFA